MAYHGAGAFMTLGWSERADQDRRDCRDQTEKPGKRDQDTWMWDVGCGGDSETAHPQWPQWPPYCLEKVIIVPWQQANQFMLVLQSHAPL